MKLYYYRHEDNILNFGDDLNPWLWDKLLPGLFNDDDTSIFVGIGTLLNWKTPTGKKTIVFGTGVGYRYGNPNPKIDISWKVYCLRGPLSAKTLNLPSNLGITDGAALIKSAYTPTLTGKYKYSYMPHIGNTNLLTKQTYEDLGIQYIDPNDDTESVLNKISNTEILITEAMHGAIAADSLEIPWIPVVTTNEIRSFKWNDWCKSLDLEYNPQRISPLWTPSSNKSSKRLKIYIKQKIIRRQILKLIKHSRPQLSKRNIFDTKHSQLFEKLEEFKDDYQNNLFL